MIDSNVEKVLKDGRGRYDRQFVLAEGKPGIRFEVIERQAILGPKNRFSLAANYYAPDGPRAFPVGDLVPTDDEGGYSLRYGDKTFAVKFTKDAAGVFVHTEEIK